MIDSLTYQKMAVLQEKLSQACPDYGEIQLFTAAFYCSRCSSPCYSSSGEPLIYIRFLAESQADQMFSEFSIHFCSLRTALGTSIPAGSAYFFLLQRCPGRMDLNETYLFIPAEEATKGGLIKDQLPFPPIQPCLLNFSLTGRI